MNYPNNTTFLIKTLGCKVNQYESDKIRERLAMYGFREAGAPGRADIYIINSCTVTHKADRETRRLIRHFNHLNPASKIFVAGCYAETDKDRSELSKIGGITHLIRNKEKNDIPDIIAKEFNVRDKDPSRKDRTIFTDRDRAFLKIQDGCDNRCAYCKVSMVRGQSVSRDESEILEEIGHLVSLGFKEIVLTGVCLGAWGGEKKEPQDLSYLLRSICRVEGDFRIRLSSIEPEYVTDDLIETISLSPKICDHLHVSLQSGSDEILRLMNRKYSAKQFAVLIKRIRKRIPKCAFTTDIIVGFPGEDDRAFRETSRFLSKVRPSRAHIFTYSRREGTQAFYLKNMSSEAKIKERMKALSALTGRLAFEYARKFRNCVVPVLIESRKDRKTGCLTGYSDSYIRVLVSGRDGYCNRIVPVKILKITGEGVFGKPV